MYTQYLWQLLCDVSSHKHCFQIHPQVLHRHPVVNNVRGVGQLLDPRRYVLLEGSIVPETERELTVKKHNVRCTYICYTYMTDTNYKLHER